MLLQLHHSARAWACSSSNQARSISRIAASRSGQGRGTSSSREEENEPELPPESKVYLEKKDFTLETLANKVKHDELDLQPSYQRGLVWDKKQASKLVVTALERRVVPTLYFEEGDEGQLLVMDGKQRLASLLTFYTGDANFGGLSWKGAPVELDITDDTSYDVRWHGKSYKDLPLKRQKRFADYSLSCIVVDNDTDRDVVFDIYQDINTGGVSHTAQQSRKAAFHGPYVEMLDKLANDKNFQNVQRRDGPDTAKESDRELALRFFAMLRSSEQFKTPLGRFLNQEIKQYQRADAAELERLEKLFKDTIATVWQIWGESACRQPSKPEQLNVSLWDATMVAVCKQLDRSKMRRKELVDCADVIQEAYLNLCKDETFKKSLPTTSKANVTRRIQMMDQMLQEAVPERLDRKRVFSSSMKLQLWSAASRGGQPVLCGICKHTIHRESEAEIDHITPWSLGGQTDLSNAQLVHRYCNRCKGNRVVQAAQTAATAVAAAATDEAIDGGTGKLVKAIESLGSRRSSSNGRSTYHA